MGLSTLQPFLLYPDVPVLPGAGLTQAAVWLNWTLVLVTASLWLGRPLMTRLRWVVALLVMAWALSTGVWWPPYSPVYWLGLAFQNLSFTSTLCCLVYLARQVRLLLVPMREVPAPDAVATGWCDPGWVLAGAGVLLGWLLVLDLLAWWPASLYAWGFGTAASTFVAVLVAVFWLWRGRSPGAHHGMTLLAIVMLLFVLTRLPSGNVWDALLDPWLWIVLQMRLARHIWGGPG